MENKGEIIMTQKEMMILLVKTKFGMTPTEEQLAKLQAWARDKTIPTDAWLVQAAKLLENKPA
jgi:hypothetical protein